MAGRRQISFFVDNDLFKKFSIKCIERDVSKTEAIVAMVRDFIGKN